MMKKAIIIFLALAAMSFVASAQPRAIGARIGYGLELSYQHTVGNNMVSAELGFPGFYGIDASATYDWINPGGLDFSDVWSGKGTWNWYAGVGAGAGFGFNGGGFFGAVGRIGVEYNFWFPLQLSFDWKPTLGAAFAGESSGFYTGGLYAGAIGLGVRYLF